MRYATQFIGMFTFVLAGTPAFGQPAEVAQESLPQDGWAADILNFQSSTLRTIETRQATETVEKQVTEDVEQTYYVKVRRRQYYWQRRGKRWFRCYRTVCVTEARTRTVKVTKTVTQEVVRTYEVVVDRFEPPLDDEDYVYSKVTPSIDLGSLPAATGPTYLRMRDVLDKSTVSRFIEISAEEPSTERIQSASEYKTIGGTGGAARVYVQINPRGNKLFLRVFGLQLRASTDPTNASLDQDDFAKVQDSNELTDYVEAVWTTLHDQLLAKLP